MECDCPHCPGTARNPASHGCRGRRARATACRAGRNGNMRRARGRRRGIGWGDDIGRNRANCRGCGSRRDNESTAPVGSFAANGFGLNGVHENVWKWVQGCRNDGYAGASSDGSARESGNCSIRVLRGGSWDRPPGASARRTRSRAAPGSGPPAPASMFPGRSPPESLETPRGAGGLAPGRIFRVPSVRDGAWPARRGLQGVARAPCAFRSVPAFGSRDARRDEGRSGTADGGGRDGGGARVS